MADEPDVAKLLLDWGDTILKTMITLLEHASDTAASQTALLQTVMQRWPDLADEYRRQFEAQKNESPVVDSTRQGIASIQKVRSQLRDLKAKFPEQ